MSTAAQRAAKRVYDLVGDWICNPGSVDAGPEAMADIIDEEMKPLMDVASELKRCLSVAQALKKALQEVVDGVAEYATKYERRPWEDALKLAEENGI